MPAKSKSNSAPNDSTATLGSEADIGRLHAGTTRHVKRLDLHADYDRANPPFNDSDTALRSSAFLPSKAKSQVVSEAKDHFRKDDDVRWQPSGANRVERVGLRKVERSACGKQIAKGNLQGERRGVHRFGVPPKCNANFSWVQPFIHNRDAKGMADSVLANGGMSSNQSGEGDVCATFQHRCC